ncbi:hypothetical protein QF038_003086 [Pseudarthrobacter sp. W1I19]|uniref:DUF6308 family protein n=1 Tax=Pseudarthrobacter sp. W1I19 TaxID=3042288 RepID=UPI002782BE4A|nr:DUF6308 family protein [Pseudarthrobacter sp. W1I19]MDQ0924578.1 hypothetical protein [Pseudarthrobacter sp. W1I19]
MPVPTILTEGNEEEAARLLAAYYRRTADGLPAYTGSYFNSWAGGGDSSDNVDTITADDLIAVSFLSVDIPGDAAIGLLDTHSDSISRLLKDISSDRDLADVSPSEYSDFFGTNSPATELWHVLRGRDTGRWGVGETRASKIMARKRPRLIPIYDSVVGPQMGLNGTSKNQWLIWHSAFIEDKGLRQRLATIYKLSGVEDSISDIRVMDIVLWMFGKQPPQATANINK